MYPLINYDRRGAATPAVFYPTAERLTVSPLSDEDEQEALAFLAQRPIHNFGMLEFIRSNGVVSPANRGTFYSCCDENGQLEGIALVGYFTLFETRGPSRAQDAIKAFAQVASTCSNINLVLGEERKVVSFCDHLNVDQRTFKKHRYILYVRQQISTEAHERVHQVKKATLDDLKNVITAHTQSLLDEGCEAPIEPERAAFVERCAARIERGRTWIWKEGGKLIAKAEVVADTPEVAYLEAVWVDRNERRKGYGLRFVSQVTDSLLERSAAVCVLAREENASARALYKKIGFKSTGYYGAMFI